MPSFSERTGREKAIEVARWVLVLPAAVLAVIAIGAIAGLARPPVFAQLPGMPVVPPSDFYRFILPRIFGVLVTAAFVLAGAWTSPRRRPIVAIVLAALWTINALLIHVVVHLGRGKPHYLDFAFAIAAAAGAAGYVAYSTRRVHEQNKMDRG